MTSRVIFLCVWSFWMMLRTKGERRVDGHACMSSEQTTTARCVRERADLVRLLEKIDVFFDEGVFRGCGGCTQVSYHLGHLTTLMFGRHIEKSKGVTADKGFLASFLRRSPDALLILPAWPRPAPSCLSLGRVLVHCCCTWNTDGSGCWLRSDSIR